MVTVDFLADGEGFQDESLGVRDPKAATPLEASTLGRKNSAGNNVDGNSFLLGNLPERLVGNAPSVLLVGSGEVVGIHELHRGAGDAQKPGCERGARNEDRSKMRILSGNCSRNSGASIETSPVGARILEQIGVAGKESGLSDDLLVKVEAVRREKVSQTRGGLELFPISGERFASKVTRGYREGALRERNS